MKYVRVFGVYLLNVFFISLKVTFLMPSKLILLCHFPSLKGDEA